VIWSKIFTCLHVKYSLFLSDFNETKLYRQVFEKFSNIKFNENPPLGAELFQGDGWKPGQTDRHDESNSCFLQFCESD
jgi:hypothetical protein